MLERNVERIRGRARGREAPKPRRQALMPGVTQGGSPPATQSGVVNRQRLGHSTCDTGSHVAGTDLRGQKSVFILRYVFFFSSCFGYIHSYTVIFCSVSSSCMFQCISASISLT